MVCTYSPLPWAVCIIICHGIYIHTYRLQWHSQVQLVDRAQFIRAEVIMFIITYIILFRISCIYLYSSVFVPHSMYYSQNHIILNIIVLKMILIAMHDYILYWSIAMLNNLLNVLLRYISNCFQWPFEKSRYMLVTVYLQDVSIMYNICL